MVGDIYGTLAGLKMSLNSAAMQGSDAYQDNLAESIQAGYSGEKLDLVVPVTPSHFNLPGVESASGVRETIDLALRFHPDTQAVAIIAKASGPDDDWFQEEHSELLRDRDKVTEIALLGPASPQLLQRVAELPPHSVILFQLYPEDSNQPAFGALDVLAAVTERFPTYSILPHITVGHGALAERPTITP